MFRRLLAGVVSLVAAFPATCPAQVTFPVRATASYFLDGQAVQFGFPIARYSDQKSLLTNNPLAEPVRLVGSVGGTVGSGGAAASMFANATAEASAGLMRAKLDGSTSAAWNGSSSTSEAQVLNQTHVTVGWTDSYMVLGSNPSAPPGRPLRVHAFLNLSGGIEYDLNGTAFNFLSPGFSSVNLNLRLRGEDNLGQPLIAVNGLAIANESQYVHAHLNPSFTLNHTAAPGVMPVTMNVLEGVQSFMSFQMSVTAVAISNNGFNNFGPDSTSASFDLDFGHTLGWGGITSVIDVDTGLPVTNWSITSGSGVNYAVAVPEPTTVTTALVAGSLLLRRRFRLRE